jgi:hypothetical protein
MHVFRKGVAFPHVRRRSRMSSPKRSSVIWTSASQAFSGSRDSSTARPRTLLMAVPLEPKAKPLYRALQGQQRVAGGNATG